MSKIEWTGKTWNPVTGCDKISAGCKNCYAEKMANRLKAMGSANYADGFKLTLQPQMLDIPLKRKKPTVYFVNPTSNLFHADVPFEYIDKVFAVMALCPQHTFQVLTKRADRMRDYLNNLETRFRIADEIRELHNLLENDDVGNAACRTMELQDKGVLAQSDEGNLYLKLSPLPNVWLGVSVENQKVADERIPLLLKTPASVRFLSCEPLLEETNIRGHLLSAARVANCECGHGHGFTRCPNTGSIAKSCHVWKCACEQFRGINGVHWVIVGGESGNGARPCDIAWIRSIVGQCKAANVPVFVKQLGAKPFNSKYLDEPHTIKLKNKKGADISEFPEDLQKREMPVVR